MVKTGRHSFQQMLRLTEELRDLLRESAEKNNRSMNAEIVSRLEATFDVFTSEKEINQFVDQVSKDNSWAREILNSVQQANAELRETMEGFKSAQEHMKWTFKFADLLGEFEGLSEAQKRKLQNLIEDKTGDADVGQ